MDNISVNSTVSSIGFISILSYLGIDYKILGLYAFLLSLDFVTGVIKGYSRKELQSSIAINGMFKKLVLIFLIFAIGTTAKIVGVENISGLIGVSFSTLAVAELYSIVSNIYEVRTGKRKSEFDGVSFVISNILCIIESQIKKFDYKKERVDINSKGNDK